MDVSIQINADTDVVYMTLVALVIIAIAICAAIVQIRKGD